MKGFLATRAQPLLSERSEHLTNRNLLSADLKATLRAFANTESSRMQTASILPPS